jgi:hypothetical protein
VWLSGCPPSDGKDAFHSVPGIPQPNKWDAVESVLTGGEVGRGGTRPYQRDGSALSHSFSVTEPLDVMDTPLERPVVWILHQALSQRVFANISQLLLILDPIPHPMVERPALPIPCLVGVLSAEQPLPECDPCLNAEMEVIRRAEEMQVVGRADNSPPATLRPGRARCPPMRTAPPAGSSRALDL